MSKDRVMFVIGDVAGHGLEAAVAMNRARQTLISAALVDADPGPMLARANAELLRQNAQMVTVVCGHADASTYEFTYASAGHPPPILVEPGQPPRMLEFGGLPLAVMDAAVYRTIRVQSVPGAMLVLYTDGAVEHSKDVLRGESTLLEAVAQSVADEAANPAAAIHEAIFTDRSVGDDVAILTVAFAKAGAGTADDADGGAIVAAAARGRTKGVTGTVVSLVDRLLRKHAS
jgi:serine phosphatase RsbU (regulator of sigma subunit)